jgi:microcystin-dependent protein
MAEALAAEGWLFCDGRPIDRVQFKLLFDVIGEQYGWDSGPNSSRFNLPDYRGYFLRGTDHGAGHDPDIALRGPQHLGGSVHDQVGAFQPFATARPAYAALTMRGAGGHNHFIDALVQPVSNKNLDVTGMYPDNFDVREDVHTSDEGDHVHLIDGGGDHETRPANVSIDFIIRFM